MGGAPDYRNGFDSTDLGDGSVWLARTLLRKRILMRSTIKVGLVRILIAVLLAGGAAGFVDTADAQTAAQRDPHDTVDQYLRDLNYGNTGAAYKVLTKGAKQSFGGKKAFKQAMAEINLFGVETQLTPTKSPRRVVVVANYTSIHELGNQCTNFGAAFTVKSNKKGVWRISNIASYGQPVSCDDDGAKTVFCEHDPAKGANPLGRNTRLMVLEVGGNTSFIVERLPKGRRTFSKFSWITTAGGLDQAREAMRTDNYRWTDFIGSETGPSYAEIDRLLSCYI